MGEKMTDSPEWFADEELWVATYDVMFSADRFAAAPEEVKRILALTGMSPPARVLDLCRGPGRHSIELARSGFQVTGVDRTAFLLKKAMERSSQEALSLSGVELLTVGAESRTSGYGLKKPVLDSYYQERITSRDVSEYLGIRLKHLATIEETELLAVVP